MGWLAVELDEDRLDEAMPCWSCKQTKEETTQMEKLKAALQGSGKHRACTTQVSYKNRPIMARINGRYLEVWRKGKHEKFQVSWDAIYDLAQRLAAAEVRR